MKTARFSQVVAKCGAPVMHTQWQDESKDQALKKAVKEHRLMTLHLQNVGGRKDYGEVGVAEASGVGAHRALLIFPRSLRTFEGRRVVGVKAEAVAGAEKNQAASTGKEKTGRKWWEMDSQAAHVMGSRDPAEIGKRAEVVDDEDEHDASQEEPKQKTEPKAKAKAAGKTPQKNAITGVKAKTKTGEAGKSGESAKSAEAAIRKALKLLKGYDTSGAIKVLERALD